MADSPRSVRWGLMVGGDDLVFLGLSKYRSEAGVTSAIVQFPKLCPGPRPGTVKEGPSAQIITFLGALPVMMNPASQDIVAGADSRSRGDVDCSRGGEEDERQGRVRWGLVAKSGTLVTMPPDRFGDGPRRGLLPVNVRKSSRFGSQGSARLGSVPVSVNTVGSEGSRS